MTRNFYIGLAVALALGTSFLLYKTFLLPVAEPLPTADFGGVSLRIEYAVTPEVRNKGLGGRTNIPEDYGMLFIFPKEDKYGFWMKDMLVPLDIFWLDAQGHVVFIAADIAPSSYPNVLYPIVPARYVLETAAGFARLRAIATGTPIVLKNLPAVSK